MSVPLWSPSKSNNPALIKLNELAKAKDYSELHKWSIDNSADFWRFVVSDSEIVGDFGDTAISGSGFFQTEFFPGAKLNVVDTLLKGDPNQIVITEISESGQRRTFTRGEVRKLANQVAQSLLSAGVVEGEVPIEFAFGPERELVGSLCELDVALRHGGIQRKDCELGIGVDLRRKAIGSKCRRRLTHFKIGNDAC